MQAQPTIYRRRIHASKETCQDRQAKRKENELISKDMRSRREGGREGGGEGWRDGGHLANIISPHTHKSFVQLKYNNTNYGVYI